MTKISNFKQKRKKLQKKDNRQPIAKKLRSNSKVKVKILHPNQKESQQQKNKLINNNLIIKRNNRKRIS